MTAPTSTEIDDLRLAWRRMLLDRPDRSFVSHPSSIKWIESSLGEWLSRAQEHLARGYVPRASRLCLVPKAADLLRPGLVLDLEDELVYNLLVGRLLPRIVPALLPLQGDPDIAYQLEPDTRVPLWIHRGFKIWRQWRDKSLEKLRVDVLERALHDNFSIAGNATFDATLFRFLLHRLGSSGSRAAVDYALDALRARPEETAAVIRYLSSIGHTRGEVNKVAGYIASKDAIDDYQRFMLLRWFYEEKHEVKKVLSLARRWSVDANREPWLRSYAVAYLGLFGDASDFERLEHRYQQLDSDLEKAEFLAAMKRQERGRRNALYARAKDGFFTKLAVKEVKSSDKKPIRA